jgi:hypothetical protein
MHKITRNILIISGVAILSSCITSEIKDCCKKTVQEVYEYEGLTMSSYNSMNEIANTAEDIIYWISEDVKSGYVDSVKADSYIDNLKQIIKETE